MIRFSDFDSAESYRAYLAFNLDRAKANLETNRSREMFPGAAESLVAYYEREVGSFA